MKKSHVNPYLQLLEIPPGYLNIMDYTDAVEINGLGLHAIIWLQGCLKECDDCLNPDYWSFEINQLISVEHIVKKILNNSQKQGVIFTGGEPFWQAPALTEVAKKVKAAGLNIISFTNFSLERLQSDYAPACSQKLLTQIDLLIDRTCTKSLAINELSSLVSAQNNKLPIGNSNFSQQINLK